MSPATGGGLGACIISKRKRLKMTQVDLALLVGVAVSQVSRWEANLGQPSNQTYMKLGSVLGIEPYMLWAEANGILGAEVVERDEFNLDLAPIAARAAALSRHAGITNYGTDVLADNADLLREIERLRARLRELG